MSLLPLHELDAFARVVAQVILIAGALVALLLKGVIPLVGELWDLLDEWRDRRGR